MHTSPDFQVLESLIVDNPDLERLEALLDQFNIFEAIGATQVELRHSDFLAFILNPNQPHGLGDTFVKQLLQKSLGNLGVSDFPITPIDLDIWNLGDIEVRREWRNIDLLLLDEEHKMAVIIENKIKGNEHSGQLKRYWDTIKRHYPKWRRWGLYLTPEGEEPSCEYFSPIDYTLIVEIVENLLQNHESTLGPDVYTLMEHYAQMLRRHIVSESEIADLCRRIFRKHQRALDMIYEYRPDLQEEIRHICEEIAKNTPGVVMDHCTKSRIRFTFEEIDFPILKQGSGWTPSGRMLILEFLNDSKRLALAMVLGPGPIKIRQRIFDFADKAEFFHPSRTELGERTNTLSTQNILPTHYYEEKDLEDIEKTIHRKWEQFLEQDKKKIVELLRSQEWLTEEV